ncbi:MAG: hypothetical protein KDJ47_14225 [Hyphomicrobiaceae bacterium]|nr:hypothetical protein [Hyphomicrobiaceae bacterium]
MTKATTAADWLRGDFRLRAAMALTALVASFAVALPANADELATQWVEGHNVRTRLLAGHATASDADGALSRKSLVAGLEMQLSPGWKTYWRTPGDAGGVPPEFDWSGSGNLKEARVHYPAPRRMTDSTGNTIGYKENVLFPIFVEPQDAGKPVTLKLRLAFGICHDICVPSETSYEITLPALGETPHAPAIASALSRVPLRDNGSANKLPRLLKVESTLDGPHPKVSLQVAFPNGQAGADVFVEGPPGEFVPLPSAKGTVGGGALLFEIDLTQGADVSALKGKALRATMVSAGGHSEAEFVLK